MTAPNFESKRAARAARAAQLELDRAARQVEHPLTVRPASQPEPKIVTPQPARVRQSHTPRLTITVHDSDDGK